MFAIADLATEAPGETTDQREAFWKPLEAGQKHSEHPLPLVPVGAETKSSLPW